MDGVKCNYCERWWPIEDDSLFIHVLIAHPNTEEAEAVLAWKHPPRVPRVRDDLHQEGQEG